MMHADLIDQDDFRERLQALGFSVPPDSTPEQACEYAVRGLSPERAQALRRLVEDMLGGHATLLPAVREAISRQLLPALVPRPLPARGWGGQGRAVRSARWRGRLALRLAQGRQRRGVGHQRQVLRDRHQHHRLAQRLALALVARRDAEVLAVAFGEVWVETKPQTEATSMIDMDVCLSNWRARIRRSFR